MVEGEISLSPVLEQWIILAFANCETVAWLAEAGKRYAGTATVGFRLASTGLISLPHLHHAPSKTSCPHRTSLAEPRPHLHLCGTARQPSSLSESARYESKIQKPMNRTQATLVLFLTLDQG